MYTLSIYLFITALHIAAKCGNRKAQKMIEGRQRQWTTIKAALKTDERRVWIHCASLGEYEQGLPLLEDIKAQYPQYKTVVTFFSPSGYEVKKGSTEADYMFYLPFDTQRNARCFMELVKPEVAYFIKYEFWRNYLHAIRKKGVPLYLVSAIFRREQAFFKWYGAWYRKMLDAVTHFFVQYAESKQLLENIGYTNVTITGDTRFDRVCRIADRARQFPDVERFVNKSICIVAGSTWPSDDALFLRYINREKRPVKWIFAPHELRDEQINRFIANLDVAAVRYSQLAGKDPAAYSVLIIDCFGMLSSLYRYGQMAYIGGGFDKNNGIHNAIEAAVYGIPVVFGPVYSEYQEAVHLVAAHGAVSVNDYEGLAAQINQWIDHTGNMEAAGAIAGAFVASGRGATVQILTQTLHDAR